MHRSPGSHCVADHSFVLLQLFLQLINPVLVEPLGRGVVQQHSFHLHLLSPQTLEFVPGVERRLTISGGGPVVVTAARMLVHTALVG